MKRAGVPSNRYPVGDRSDAFEEAEAEYRRTLAEWDEHGYQDRQPVYGCAKFRFRGRWFLFDQVRSLLRDALELEKPQKKRSLEARRLEAALHDDEPHVEHILSAKDKLLGIYSQLRAIDEIDLASITLQKRPA